MECEIRVAGQGTRTTDLRLMSPAL